MRWGLVIAVALVAVLLSGCASIPTEHGRLYTVGDVAYATAGPDGTCTIQSGNEDHDYGKTPEDYGKHNSRMRNIHGGEICFTGSGISSNLQAAVASLIGFLAGLALF